MSRAFIIEGESMFHCRNKDRDCKYATLRGTCELDSCRYEVSENSEDPKNEKTETALL